MGPKISRRARASIGRGLAALALLPLVHGCGSDSRGHETGASGVSGAGAGGGGQGGSGGDGQAGSGAAGTGPGGTSGDCSEVSPPADGAVLGALYPDPSKSVHDVFGACDGSFVVTGYAPLGVSFQRKDGTEIALSEAILWVARFDAEGFPLWAQAAQGGESASGWWSSVTSFPDGSVAVGGVFGTNATFGAGEPNETTLLAQSDHSNGYVARYDRAGAFQWVRHIGPKNDARVWGVAAGPDNTTFAALDTAHPEGMTVAPGELDLVLEGGDAAVVTLAEDGRFLRALHYSSLIGGLTRMTALADGGVLVAGEASENALIAAGTPDETPVPPGLFLSRLTPELLPVWTRAVSVPGDTYGTALVPDGSSAFVGVLRDSITLGAGEPNEVTFTNEAGGDDGVVARLDAQGHLLWAAQLAGADEVDVYVVSAQADGSVWVAGTYGLALAPGDKSALVLSPGAIDALTIATIGPLRFVARFTSEGKPAWLVPFESDADTYLRILAISASPRSLIAVGEFDGTATFGSLAQPLIGDGVFITRVGP